MMSHSANRTSQNGASTRSVTKPMIGSHVDAHSNKRLSSRDVPRRGELRVSSFRPQARFERFRMDIVRESRAAMPARGGAEP